MYLPCLSYQWQLCTAHIHIISTRQTVKGLKWPEDEKSTPTAQVWWSPLRRHSMVCREKSVRKIWMSSSRSTNSSFSQSNIVGPVRPQNDTPLKEFPWPKTPPAPRNTLMINKKKWKCSKTTIYFRDLRNSQKFIRLKNNTLADPNFTFLDT